MNPILSAALVISAIGTIAGSGVALDHLHVARSDFDKHLSEQRVRTVFEYMNQIRVNGPQPWLCDALQQELISLCTELPDHAMCRDGAMDEVLDEVEC